MGSVRRYLTLSPLKNVLSAQWPSTTVFRVFDHLFNVQCLRFIPSNSEFSTSVKRQADGQGAKEAPPDIDLPRQDLEKHKRWVDVKRGIGPLTRDLPQRNGAGRLRRVPHQAIPKAWRRRLWTISKIWYCSPSRTIWLRSVAQRWRNAKRWRGKDGFFCGVLLLAVFSQVLPTVTLQRENLFVMLHFSVGKKQILFLEN